MSGRGKGGKGLGRSRDDDNSAQSRRRKRQEKAAQLAADYEYESEWHGVDQISQPVICTRYAGLPPDLLISSFTWLDSRDLISLRAVCRAWSAPARSDRSWVSSHWQVDQQREEAHRLYAFLIALSSPSHMPFLRSITLPIDYHPKQQVKAQILASIRGLTKLERIQFRHWVIPADLLSALPSLRHVEVQEVDCDGQGNDDFSEEEIAELCAVAQLKSFRGVALPRAESVIRQLSRAPCAAGLISLRLPSTTLEPFTRALFAPLSSLEELEVELWSDDDQDDGSLQDLSTLAGLPALRVLTFDWVDGAALGSVLRSAGAWSSRIESLTFGRMLQSPPESDAAARCIRALTQCCTSLRVLHCQWDIDTQSVTPQRWKHWKAASAQDSDPAEHQGPLSIMHLLTAPRSFRSKLLSLRFNSSASVTSSSLAHLARRFPSLLHASFSETRHSHRTSAFDNTAADYVESDLDEQQDESEGQPEEDDDDDDGENDSAPAAAQCDPWIQFDDEQAGSSTEAAATSAPMAPVAAASSSSAASALIQFSRAGGAVAGDAAESTSATAEEAEPSAAIPASMCVFPAVRLTTSVRRMLQSSPFHYLRALKQMARIPLSAGERDPSMCVAPRIPPLAVDMCV